MIAVVIGTALAIVGWIASFSRAIPLRAARQPGLEIALLLQFTYSPSVRGPQVSEWVVFVANMIFWAAVIVVGLGLRRAFRRARATRAWLVCAALLAAPLVLLSEVLSALLRRCVLWALVVDVPGLGIEAVSCLGYPRLSFVMDMPALLGELMYHPFDQSLDG